MNREASREIASAIRRFPDRTERVVRMAERDEGFRDMCEELVAAEEALSRHGAIATSAGAARRAECEGWITRLVEEMAARLDSAEIVPLPGVRQRP